MQKIHHFIKSATETFKKIKLTTPIAILLGAFIISIGIISYGFIVRESSQSSPTTSMFAGRPVDSSDYVDGKTDSKVVVIEYSDPECPFCVKSHSTMKQLRNEYGDKIAFVYRHWPLQIHPNAFDESRAIACAGIVGGKKGLYDYIDTLYGYKLSTQNPNTLRFTALQKDGKEIIAKNIGLDVPKFTSCMNGQEASIIVSKSLEDGFNAGVDGTPTTFVLLKNKKGYQIVSPISGAQSIGYFKAAIEEALSK